jgi:hypothetical protein
MADEPRLPVSLKTTIRRFGGMKKRIRLTLSSGSTSVSENDILRVRLPSNSLVQLDSFCINGTLGVAASHKIQGSHSMLRRVGMTCGGLAVNYANQNWNLLAHAQDIASQGLEWSNSNAVGSCAPDDFQTNGDKISFSYFPHSPLNAGVLDTGLTGETEVDILFAGGNVAIPDNGVTATSGFTLSNITAYVDVIQLEDPDYRKSLAAMLRTDKDKTYEKTMDLATCVVQTANGSNNFNVSTECLNKVMVVPKDQNYLTQDDKELTEVYSRFLNGVAQADSKIFVGIGSESFPAYGFSENFKELAEITRHTEGGASSYNFNKLFLTRSGDTENPLAISADAYVTQNAVASFAVGAFRPEIGMQRGIDLSSGNSVIRVETQDLPANSKLMMAACYTSRLIVKAGQVVGIKQ